MVFRSLAVFHWDLLNQANAEVLKHSSKESVLAGGQISSDNRETLMFWINQVHPMNSWIINYLLIFLVRYMAWGMGHGAWGVFQDIIVPVDEWTSLISEAVKRSPAAARLHLH